MPMCQIVAMFNCLSLAILSLGFSALQAQQPSVAVGAIDKVPSFEVASIKPSKPDDGNHDWDSDSDRLTIENYTLRDLIASAYGLKSTSQVVGGPGWLDKQHFDISAKVDDTELAKLKGITRSENSKEFNLMMQSLLAERFGLKVSHDRRTIPVFALVVIKSGIKFTPAAANDDKHNFGVHNTHMVAAGATMEALADYLTRMHESEDRVVVDRTGLTGDYNFTLDWTRDRGDGIPPDAQYPGLITALHEQLGLELKPDKAFVDVIVVASASEPELD
jgi:uncharacterized protein (TIGR03435 family)